MKDGTLEIRKTLQSNHAKLYIFENKDEFSQGGEYPGTVITGSSNFTRSGFRGTFEINVVSRDAANYTEAYRIFDTLWKDAVVIVDKDNIDDFLYNVVEKIWIDKLPKPLLLYVRVLEEYFPRYRKDALRLPGEITRGRYIDLKYQEDAIRRAMDVLQRHNGVIIADVVGLGKSIIASAVAHNLNLRAIVISPPHLIGQWEDYRLVKSAQLGTRNSAQKGATWVINSSVYYDAVNEFLLPPTLKGGTSYNPHVYFFFTLFRLDFSR